MKLFEQEEKGALATNRPKTKKILRRMKHKRERKAANENPEYPPTYTKYKGYQL